MKAYFPEEKRTGKERKIIGFSGQPGKAKFLMVMITAMIQPCMGTLPVPGSLLSTLYGHSAYPEPFLH